MFVQTLMASENVIRNGENHTENGCNDLSSPSHPDEITLWSVAAGIHITSSLPLWRPFFAQLIYLILSLRPFNWFMISFSHVIIIMFEEERLCGILMQVVWFHVWLCDWHLNTISYANCLNPKTLSVPHADNEIGKNDASLKRHLREPFQPKWNRQNAPVKVYNSVFIWILSGKYSTLRGRFGINQHYFNACHFATRLKYLEIHTVHKFKTYTSNWIDVIIFPVTTPHKAGVRASLLLTERKKLWQRSKNARTMWNYTNEDSWSRLTSVFLSPKHS